MIVAIVATGTLSFETAIPMIMGANVGTTLTSALVSLSFITKKSEYHKAFTAGIMHDMFNVILVLILFPLELSFKFLSNIAYQIQDLFNENTTRAEFAMDYSWNFATIPSHYVLELINMPILTLVISFLLLFISIKIISKRVSRSLIDKDGTNIGKLIFSSTWKSFGIGALFTAGVQSSSITTSIVVPVAAKGGILLRFVFPYIIGANIGTTITALIAAFFISTSAMTIAMIHVFFNFTGFLIFMLIPWARHFAIYLAIRFGYLAANYRLLGLAYIVLIFFIIPFALIYISQ
jgi:sodium-dependent phosphate cotransporter